ncbi:MAG: NAD(+) synthase [Ignavibacteria bacterium]|jgi:NAD+ synthase (glutamine-hydrolysing)|nr:NAD(+) synthase [Ignavibacteria bacterium]
MKTLNELNYLSVLLISPAIKVGDVKHNTELIISQMQEHSQKCNLMVFPELSVTGATCGDTFFQTDLITEANAAMYQLIEASYEGSSSIVVGAPMRINNKLVNCAWFISEGKILGIVPKNESNRWFSVPNTKSMMINGYEVPIGNDLIFTSFCKLGICVGKPTISALNNLSEAEVVVSIDASQYSYTHKQHYSHSADNYSTHTISKLTSQAILYVNANPNESSAEGIYDGKMLVTECGRQLENSFYINKDKPANSDKTHLKYNNDPASTATRFSFDTRYYYADIDIDLIRGNRRRNLPKKPDAKQHIRFDFYNKPQYEMSRLRKDSHSIDNNINLKSFYVDPFHTKQISQNFTKALEIIDAQAFALARRMKHIGTNSVVLGVSSGIDSTLALIICDRCFDILGYDKKNIYAFGMPGLATSDETNDIAQKLADSLGVSYSVISINDAVKQHFADIKHDDTKKDIVYENAQARYRTMLLFDYANKVNGIVIGTGDMSEIALGWCTYNGDHMSNYDVNAGVPKTVAKAILQCLFYTEHYPNLDITQVKRIIEKPITPELLPVDENGNTQDTESILGPFEIHDFYMYYYLSHFLSAEKLLYIATCTFDEKYSDEVLQRCLNTFLKRFRTNQYKRSCSADGPSIFDISLSPRTGFMMPSDI